jgi:hypothetical protein
MANAWETTLAVSYYFNLISYCKDFEHGGIFSVIFFMSYVKNVRFTDMWYDFSNRVRCPQFAVYVCRSNGLHCIGKSKGHEREKKIRG